MSAEGGARRVALVAALVVVTAVVLQRIVGRAFVLNFTISGPNASVLLVFGLLTAWTLPAAVRLGWAPSLRRAGAVLPVAVLASAAPDSVVAAVAGVVALALATPWLVALAAHDRAFVPGFAAGVAALAAIRGWLGTLPTYATLEGVALLVGVAFLAGALALTTDPPDRGASAVAWLAVVAQGLFLGVPAATAAWSASAYAPTVLATVAGVVLGALWASRDRALKASRDRALGVPGTAVIGVAFTLAWVDVVWVGQLDAVAVGIAQLAFVRLLAAGLRDDGVRWLVLAQAVALLGVVAQLLATNWAYVPGGAALAGQAPLVLFGLGLAPVVAILAVAIFAVVPRADGTDPEADAAAGTPTETGDSDGESDGDSDGESDVDSDGDVLEDPGRRNVLLSAVPAGAAALSLAPTALAGGSGTVGESGGPPYRVLTLNVHQWIDGDAGGHNFHAVRDAIADADPHVVGLQETEGARYWTGATNGVRWLADELDYHHEYGVPTKRGGYGVSLLSKHPISDAEVVSLPVHESPPRWALLATVEAPAGAFQVVVTHFQTNAPADDRQLAEAETLVDAMRASVLERSVVLGDFNVQPDQDPAYDYLREELTDAWTAAGHDRLDGGGTWPAGDPTQRIDYVWLDGDWSVSNARRVGDETVSDHLGVLATIDPGEDV
jgi:endonuclease/exonuclease/phosphatase family metal-dependent hydrolase